MSLGKKNKRLGSNAERLYAKLFRELGFTFCKTSRQASRVHDDAGIDLMYLPFNVQIKAGFQRGMNPSNVLNTIRERIKELFPPDSKEHQLPNILIHRKHVGRGKNRDDYDDLVTMSFNDFIKIIENGDIYNPKRKN